MPPEPLEPSAQPAPPVSSTRGMNLGSSKVLGQDVDGDKEVDGATAVDRFIAVGGDINVDSVTAVDGDKDVDSDTVATDEQLYTHTH